MSELPDGFFTESRFYSRHNGKTKLETKDCGRPCKYMAEIDGERRCYWGVAWKRLSATDNPRKCEYIDMESPREESLLARDEAMKELQKAREKTPAHAPRYYFDPIGRREEF